MAVLRTLEEDFRDLGLIQEEAPADDAPAAAKKHPTVAEGERRSADGDGDGDDAELDEQFKVVRKKRRKRRKRMTAADRAASRKQSKKWRRSAKGKAYAKRRSKVMKKVRARGVDTRKVSVQMQDRGSVIGNLLEEIQGLVHEVEDTRQRLDLTKGFGKAAEVMDLIEVRLKAMTEEEESAIRIRRIERRMEKLAGLRESTQLAVGMVQDGKTTFQSKDGETISLEAVLNDVTDALDRYMRFLRQ
jgi:hypothetical protein